MSKVKDFFSGKKVDPEKIKNFFSKGLDLTEKYVGHLSEKTESAKEYWDKNKDDFYVQGKERAKIAQEYASTAYELAESTSKSAASHLSEKSQSAKDYWSENKASFHAQEKEAVKTGVEYVSSTYESTLKSVSSLYQGIKHPESELKDLEKRIENQGGHYRELNRNTATFDSIILGGERLVTLLSASTIPDEIINAYEAAYPKESALISFKDKVLELDEQSLNGLISGIKGKLFEQKYVDYLNDGNLPYGSSAILAESVTQPGWDIQIINWNAEIQESLQLKATDSISYVKNALEKYPNIDIVTTDEVYSHLVMTGISENIRNSTITNQELMDIMDKGVAASNLTMDYSPPLFALALIAFTSYKDASLTLFEKARSAGDRTGKTYLSYLIGGGIATVTNTWWLGVLGSVSSRLLSESGSRKFAMYEKLKHVEKNNQTIIDKLLKKAETP